MAVCLCLQLYKVDFKRDLLYVIGSVPGTNGGYVEVKDCQKIMTLRREKVILPPFPATPAEIPAILSRYQGTAPKLEWVMDPPEHDPFGMHDWHEPEPV